MNSNELRKFIPLTLYLALLVGCGGSLRVRSNPANAKVSIVHSDSQKIVDVGETPMDLTHDKVSEIQPKGPYLVRLRKEGFQDKDILVPSLSGLSGDLAIELKASPSSVQFNDYINQLFEAQAMAQKGNTQGALEKLDALEKQRNDISALYEMRGSLYMISGQFPAAVTELEKALRLDSQNVELRKLLDAAQKRTGAGPVKDRRSEVRESQ